MYSDAANGRPLLRHCPLSFKRFASPTSPIAFEARSKLLMTSSSRRNALRNFKQKKEQPIRIYTYMHIHLFLHQCRRTFYSSMMLQKKSYLIILPSNKSVPSQISWKDAPFVHA